MRILHVVEVSIGGVVSVVNTYADYQLSAGDDVHVLAPREALLTAGTRHYWRPERRTPHHLPTAVRDLRRLVAELAPDVIHLHSFFPGVLGRIRPLGAGGPAVVYQPHSWAFDAAPTPMGTKLVEAWERRAARRTDAIIVNCDDELREGERHGVQTAAHVVGIPVDTTHFAPADEFQRQTHRRDLGVSDRAVLLCVGRLAKQKGQDLLVQAWQQTPVPGAVLVLLGAGDPRPLAQLAGDQWGQSVVAPGAVEDVRPWLHAADLVVAPSRWESQEVAVMEALACGKAVVATEVNGAREAIEDGPEPAAGAVVGQLDMTAFLDACRLRVIDRATLIRESTAARARAERMSARDAVMTRVRVAYDRAISSRSASAASGRVGL